MPIEPIADAFRANFTQDASLTRPIECAQALHELASG